ncbi:iron-sulfur cluster assembly scaffold protein [Alkalilimnicola sp. S0819]|uniref:iron-sulfur cluster assembly scaffold protein n=1 Tax=Alkalilimnicola sp. S0819 TaxID=2613922 RepID=UPI001869B35A|nr:iron-sulfur cluster assembly scaffold protein [Alkalilimnicola sp. S0819]
MAWSEVVLRHYRELPGAGLPAGACSGEAGRVAEGRRVVIGLTVDAERIVDAGFLAFGCPATLAAAAWLSQWLPGRGLDEVRGLRGLEIAEALALPAERLSAALVVEDALRAALACFGEPPTAAYTGEYQPTDGGR